jgi:hypothetical protein
MPQNEALFLDDLNYLYIYIYIYVLVHVYIYIYKRAERQIIEAYFYAMFYILLNSCKDDHYVPSDCQMQQGLQQTWT